MRMTPCRGKPHHSSKSLPPEGRKVGSLKRRVRSQLARWEMKNCTPLWREAHLQVKMCKARQVRSTFGSWDVEKVHAAVAQRTFRSQNVQNTPRSAHFWKLRCWKSARRCGAKHISKSKCTKHTILGPLLEVQMSQKCTPLWREAHFQVKMYKTHHVGTIFGGSDVASVRFTTLHSTTLHTTLHTTLQLQLHSTTLHYTPLHSTKLHCTTIHYTTLHYSTLPSTTLHYITLHYTTLRSTTLQIQIQLHNYTPLHSATLNYTTHHYITLHYTPLQYITLHSTTQQIQLHNYTPLHSTTLHYTPLH